MVTHRFEIWLVRLDPTVGAEMQKTRPAVVLSPDELNDKLRTVLVAPLTTKGFVAPFRVSCEFAGQTGQIALDQLRAMDQSRPVRCLGILPPETARRTLLVLAEMFAE